MSRKALPRLKKAPLRGVTVESAPSPTNPNAVTFSMSVLEWGMNSPEYRQRSARLSAAADRMARAAYEVTLPYRPKEE